MAADPEPITKPQRLRLLWAVAVLLLPGCFGVDHNPSYVPHLFPFGDTIPTHAKPPGFAYFTNFDPHACHLDVQPVDVTLPVYSQQVLIATVSDEKGEPRRNRRVEWMIEGGGNVIEVDESGFFPGRGYKVDNKYAVSYTDWLEHKVSRNPDDAAACFPIKPGQSWCVISSAVEGDTYVTVYAPEIANWENHKVFVRTHWIDAEWRFPPPCIARAGTEQVLTTQVYRHTDHQPLAGYDVRYRILDGPPAVFVPKHVNEQVAVTDLDGNAHVTLAQVQPQAGANRIGIEVIRAPDRNAPSGAGIVIARGETRVDWQAPQISFLKTAPAAVLTGQDITYTLTVSNNGQVASQEITVRDTLPEGLQHVRSDPPAIVEGNQLIWTMPPLAAGRGQTVQLVCHPSTSGPFTNTALVTTPDGVHSEQRATTQITAPRIDVKMSSAPTAILGLPHDYQIIVTNPGSAPANNVVLEDDFDAGLEHDSKADKVRKAIGTLAAGQSQTVDLSLTPRQAGKLVNRVVATGDGNLIARDQAAVDVQRGQVRVDLNGPSKRYVNRPAPWGIRVVNTGEVALSNVVVRDQLPPALTFVKAGQGGTVVNGEVVWNLGTLQAGEQKLLELETNAAQLTQKALNVALVTADPGLQAQSEAAIEINGLPAFRLEVQDLVDPVEVGEKTKYVIDVLNQGTLAGNKIEILGTVPPEMKVLTARGPTTPKIEGNQIIFPAVDSLPPGQKVSYEVEVEALRVGDVRFRAELRSTTLQGPVVEEESTNIVAATSAPLRPALATVPPTTTGQPPTATPPPGPLPVATSEPPTAPTTPPTAGLIPVATSTAPAPDQGASGTPPTPAAPSPPVPAGTPPPGPAPIATSEPPLATPSVPAGTPATSTPPPATTAEPPLTTPTAGPTTPAPTTPAPTPPATPEPVPALPPPPASVPAPALMPSPDSAAMPISRPGPLVTVTGSDLMLRPPAVSGGPRADQESPR